MVVAVVDKQAVENRGRVRVEDQNILCCRRLSFRRQRRGPAQTSARLSEEDALAQVVRLVLRYAGCAACCTPLSRAIGCWLPWVGLVVVLSPPVLESTRPSSASIDQPRLDSMHAVQKSPNLGTLL